MNSCHARKPLHLIPLVLLTGFAMSARAELRLLASATSDSYQSLTFGLSGFCQAAGFPFALTEINDTASELLLIPNLAGVDVQQRLWLFWLAEEQKNHQLTDLASVAVLPTTDFARTTMLALTNAYPVVRAEEGRVPLWQLSQHTDPLATPQNEAASKLYVAVRRNIVYVSASREALLWAASRALPVSPADADAAAGQVRFDIQPAAIAALLEEYFAPSESSARLTDIAARVLADIRALSLALEIKTGGITARLAVTPEPNSRLTTLIQRMHPPAEALWKIFPDQATVAVASGDADLWSILDTDGTNQAVHAQTAKHLLGDCLTRDSAIYISRTSATGSLYYAQIWGITNRDIAWNRARADPLALLPFDTSFRFVTNQMRTVCQTPVLDLVRSGFVARADSARNMASMTAFIFRDGGVSLAATSNHLALTFGPSNAIEQVLLRLKNPPLQASLPARCRKLLPDLPDTACAAAMLQPAGLVSQVAASLPGSQAEPLTALPLQDTGIAASAVRDKTNNMLRLALCISADEVSRMQATLSKGQSVLQELFMLMAMQQMLRGGPPLDLPDPRDPHRQP